MTHNHGVSATTHINIRTWKHGELPMPDWIPRHIAGGIECNGTFELETDLGHVRVHPGNMVIERCGSVWVCPIEETKKFIASIELATDPTITNIGPGKAHQFGTDGRLKGKTLLIDLRLKLL